MTDACEHYNEMDRTCGIISELIGKSYQIRTNDCKICNRMTEARGVNCYTLMIAESVRDRDPTDFDEQAIRYMTDCGNEHGNELREVLASQAGIISEPKFPRPENIKRPAGGERGPGTELRKLISWFASEKKGCKCKDREITMNNWGAVKCRKNIDVIVKWLMDEGKDRGWPGGALVEFAARNLVRKAINNSTTQRGRVDERYHVAITTAPRVEATLQICLDSFRHAGFEPIIYAEPDSPGVNAASVRNRQRLGVWHNWLASARDGIASGRPYIITAQDDVTIHPDSRKLIEKLLVEQPEAFNGFLSLYTPKHYSIIKGKVKPVGVRRVVTGSLWGACCLVWRREVLAAVLEHPRVEKWVGASLRTKSAQERVFARRRENPHLIANSDTAIGRIMNDMKLPMFFVDPSPAIHIAEHSAIGHGGNNGRRNCWRCADPDQSLFEQLQPDTTA